MSATPTWNNITSLRLNLDVVSNPPTTYSETQSEDGFWWSVVQCCGTDSIVQSAIVYSLYWQYRHLQTLSWNSFVCTRFIFFLFIISIALWCQLDLFVTCKATLSHVKCNVIAPPITQTVSSRKKLYYSVSQKTSPTFLAVTLESIVGFS